MMGRRSLTHGIWFCNTTTPERRDYSLPHQFAAAPTTRDGSVFHPTRSSGILAGRHRLCAAVVEGAIGALA
jgi:hypothetical protein